MAINNSTVFPNADSLDLMHDTSNNLETTHTHTQLRKGKQRHRLGSALPVCWLMCGC